MFVSIVGVWRSCWKWSFHIVSLWNNAKDGDGDGDDDGDGHDNDDESRNDDVYVAMVILMMERNVCSKRVLSF